MANGEQFIINILKYGYSNEQMNAAAITYLLSKASKSSHSGEAEVESKKWRQGAELA